MMFKKIKISAQKQKIIFAFIISIITVFSLGTLQVTMGRLTRSSVLTNSAVVAEFDVVITDPEEFSIERGETIFEYYFLSDIDIKGLSFRVSNNGEANVRCMPYIDDNIAYRIYVEGEECAEFVVAANESVDFWLIIAPIGLNASIKSAELFIDIQQAEGV